VAWSSTTSTGKSSRLAGQAAAEARPLFPKAEPHVEVEVLPLPTSLSTQIRPP